MLGSSRSSFEQARSALAERARQASQSGFDSLGAELLAVSGLLAGSHQLRAALADSGSPAENRRAVVERLLAGQVSEPAVEVVADVAGRRWSRPRDVVDTVEGLGIEAYLINAETTGRSDRVEDELFRVARTVSGDEGLRSALTDNTVDVDARVGLIGELLQNRTAAETIELVRHIVGNLRGRRLEEALDTLVEQAARRRERLLAVAQVAAPITDTQYERLTAALARVYNREIDLQVQIDPEILGGVVVTVEDEVIDGSIAHRIAQVRRSMDV